jgi:NarL family two-component system response regulator LiaR
MFKTKFIIADDHPTFREGLRKILESTDEFECTGETGDGLDAISLVKELSPDITLVDIDMPGLSGIEVAKRILAFDRNLAVIVLSAYDYDSYVLSALKAGVRGYILKTIPPDELIEALHLIYSGKTVIGVSSKDKIKAVINHQADIVDTKNKANLFGDRELTVLNLLSKGLTNKEIANRLEISERTVQAHLVNVFKKTGTNSRTKAVLYALKGGWISLYD